ncbi:hypothetical protein [Halomonas cupida]|uniref:hypothetical protein n=1 Tax=Halomonas cupida TaxID=44933 RepID=UPI003A8F2DE1
MSEWISVYVRQPVDGQIVKSRISSEAGFCGRCEFHAESQTFRTYSNSRNRFEITIWKHDEWMPLPEQA